MDKVLLITGASSGIGAATARAASAAGWRVGLMARSEGKLDELVAELGQDRAIAVAADVTSAEAQHDAIAKVVERFGRLDAAFANAGMGTSSKSAETADLDDWRKLLDVNIWGLLVTTRMVLPELRKTKGHLLLTGSRAAKIELSGSAYGATKHFVHGFAANLLAEMRPWGGRCTVLAPGVVDTAFFDSPKPDGLKPEDVANAAVYALERPPHVAIGEVTLMPVPQS